jgi:hypothetical protein
VWGARKKEVEDLERIATIPLVKNRICQNTTGKTTLAKIALPFRFLMPKCHYRELSKLSC